MISCKVEIPKKSYEDDFGFPENRHEFLHDLEIEARLKFNYILVREITGLAFTKRKMKFVES